MFVFLCFPLQLMGSFVLAVGLWLRFDPETVSLLNDDKAPDTFFIGERHNTIRTVEVCNNTLYLTTCHIIQKNF